MELWNQDTMNAPWGVDSRTTLAAWAVKFFNPINYVDSCNAISKDPNKNPELFSLTEFMTYLENKKAFDKKPNVFRVSQILQRMSSVGILHNLGGKLGEPGFFSDSYLFLNALSETRRQGYFWLAPALGADFLFHLSAPGVVHITGKNKDGDVKAGSGFIFHPHHILTCRHVVCDMQLDDRQTFQGLECVVDEKSIHKHETDDVAVIRVDKPLKPVAGLVFQSPVIAQTVFTLGYPKIPCTREALLTMQSGAVTSESVISLQGENLFLYSAISRPGNSGGPVISEEGYVVGISSEDLTIKSNDEKDSAFSPHYAGVPSHIILKAVADMGLDVEIPFEDFE